MNKRQILDKLEVDHLNAKLLVDKELVSFDSKVKLEAIIDYIDGLVEYIHQEGKV